MPRAVARPSRRVPPASRDARREARQRVPHGGDLLGLTTSATRAPLPNPLLSLKLLLSPTLLLSVLPSLVALPEEGDCLGFSGEGCQARLFTFGIVLWHTTYYYLCQ